MPDPLPVCCALIEQNDRVLVAQRPAHKHLGGEWEFPGGKVENDESPAEALCREITEELGCTIEIVAPLPPVRHDYPNCPIEMYPFVARLTADSATPHPHEHSALKWLDRNELAIAKLAPADIPVIPSYLERFN